MINKSKKIVIFIGYKCNNKCGFCINYEKQRDKNISTPSVQEIIKKIYLAKKNGASHIEFIGGEPTIHEKLDYFICFAKKIGIKKVSFATNGINLSNFKLAKKIVNSGVNEIIFSIHGHNPAIHDNLTNTKNSFSKIKKALSNLIKLNFRNIHGNTIIVKQNLNYLKNIADFYINNGIKDVEWIFPDPTYGGCKINFYHYVPKISDVSVKIKELFSYVKKLNVNRFFIRYVPLCLFLDNISKVSELNEFKNFLKIEHWATDFINKDVIKNRINISRIKTNKCKKCRFYTKCEGIWKEYIKNYGDSELKPIK